LAQATGACRGLRRGPAGAYAGGQTRRAGVPPSSTTIAAAKKGANKANPSFELWYADATTFDLLPHLVQCWTKKGHQLKVKTPGKNKKIAAFGALGHGCGTFLYYTQPRVTAWGMRHLIQRLLRRAQRSGKKIVLVLDQGNPNHARALHRDLEMAQPHIDVFWLPNYCWNLNLIERLWKHIKGSRVANVLFASYRKFIKHVEAALEDFAKHPDLTLSVTTRKARNSIGTNLVAYT
jgi:transposase